MSNASNEFRNTGAIVLPVEVNKRMPSDVRFESDGLGGVTLRSGSEDGALNLKGALGAVDEETALCCIQQAASTHPSYQTDIARACNESMTQLENIGAKDGVEAMLAVQMVAVHNLAVRAIAKANFTNDTEVAAKETSRASKTLQTFSKQLKALNSYRGYGQQKITVEHVSIDARRTLV